MKYVLFGSGDYYKRFRHWFDDRNVVAILDNDHQKQGTELDGRPVLAPSDITELDYDAVVILSFYVTEMKKQLSKLGVSSDRIFHFYDLHDLFQKEGMHNSRKMANSKSILLLSHDLTFGGPALALYHAAVVLSKKGYNVVFASMQDGDLRGKLEDSFIPVIIDKRLQISTMKELPWVCRFDLLLCNTINFNVFLSDRDKAIPIIWWLHDSLFFYEGIKDKRLVDMDFENIKVLSVGPVPRNAMNKYRSDISINDLIYGVSNGI